MLIIGLMVAVVLVSGCSIGPMSGLIYTRIKYPLTKDLNNTPVPLHAPKDAKIIEIKEPFTGLGINARLSTNAIGELAKMHGMETLYFADQERFSILGIWTHQKVILYGK
jgi:hypothetical protein